MKQKDYLFDPRVKRWAWILGLAGLIPFVAHTVVVLTIAPPFNFVALSSQVMYAALILTFVGGLHWGVLLVSGDAFSRNQVISRLVWSVMPSLYAFWFAQITLPKPLPYLAAGLVGALLVDAWLYSNSPGTELKEFLPLRLVLTAVASLCLLVTWIYSPV